MESPIFIVGLHRTGSTLWHNIVSMSPEVCRLTEIRFLAPRWWHRDVAYFIETYVGPLDVDGNVDRMTEMFFSRNGYAGLEGAFWRFENYEHIVGNPEFRQGFATRIKKSDRSLGSVFRALVEEITRVDGKRRACVKFPLDINYVPRLLEWYPRGKVVHITRDPRAIAVSKANDPSGTALRIRRHPVLSPGIRAGAMFFAAMQYVWSSRLHASYRGLKGYRLFRYEDLLDNPEKVVRELCGFVELDFSPDMLHPEKGMHEHQRSSITGKQTKAFDGEAAWRWKEVLSPRTALLIELITKRSMKRFGYDPSKYLE